MLTVDDAARLATKNQRLAGKVQVLEAMVEDRSREAYLEQERRQSLIALLQHCQRASDSEQLLAGCLDILLDRDFLRAMQRGAAYTVAVSGELLRVAERNLDEKVRAACARVPFGRCLCGRAAASGVVTFATDDEECDHGRLDLSPHSHYCVPVTVAGRSLALFLLCIPGRGLSDAAEEVFLKAATDAVAGALLRLRHQEEINGYQRRLEEMLREKTRGMQDAEARYWRLFENAFEGVFRSSPSGRILDCNPAFARMLGYDNAAAIIVAVTDIASQLYADPEDRARLFAILEEQGQATGFVTRMRRRDGRVIWVEINSRLVAEGEREEWILEGMATDISRRRETEEALAAEKERLAVTLRSIGDGVITTDTDGRVTMLNRVAETLTGWREDAARGRPITEIFRIVNEKTRIPCENPLEKVFATGGIVGLANHTALIAKDGTERAIADSGAPIRDRDSRIIGAVLVFRDVTHQSRMEAEIQKIKKLESIGVLAGGIAHDFNNILTAILGNISLVLRLVGEDDQIHELMTDAEKATLRAKRLTQQLLTFAKGGEPVKETAAIAEVIRESADFILHGSAAAISYQLPDDLRLVHIDRGQMSQVVQNIVMNASQAMPGGGNIAIAGKNVFLPEDSPLPLKAGQYVRIDILDEGIGIPERQIEKIFDPYFTTKQQGSGLGLAITHSIVRKHEGHIEARSVLGSGTTFSIFLPANNDTAVAAQPPGKKVAAAGGRVLIMDDEAIVRKICGAMLGHLGYETECVVDGRDVLTRVSEAREAGAAFDAVIMDLTVPGGMGGVETARQLRDAGVDAALIASSGYFNDPVMAGFRDHGFDGAISKPYEVEELATTLRRALEARRKC